MSDATTTEKPTPEEKPAQAAAPQEPVEKPFTVDVLISCTARFTRKSWDLFLTFRKENLDLMKTVPLRATLMARTPEGAQELQGLLKETGVTEITAKGKNLEFTATFADIQQVIKHPQAYMLDVKKA